MGFLELFFREYSQSITAVNNKTNERIDKISSRTSFLGRRYHIIKTGGKKLIFKPLNLCSILVKYSIFLQFFNSSLILFPKKVNQRLATTNYCTSSRQRPRRAATSACSGHEEAQHIHCSVQCITSLYRAQNGRQPQPDLALTPEEGHSRVTRRDVVSLFTTVLSVLLHFLLFTRILLPAVDLVPALPVLRHTHFVNGSL